MSKPKKTIKKPVFKPTPMTLTLNRINDNQAVKFSALLFPRSIDGDTARVAGHLLSPEGLVVADVEIDEMPVEMLHQNKPAGRKTDDDKRLTGMLTDTSLF